MSRIIKMFIRNKVSVLIVGFIIVYVIFSIFFFNYAFEKRDEISAGYMQAVDYFEEENYVDALKIFGEIQNYRDVDDYIIESKYNIAITSFENGDYEEAEILFTELGDYEDSEIYLAQIDIKNIDESKFKIYEEASSLFVDGDYEAAITLFETIHGYKDATQRFEECALQIKRRNLKNILATGVRTSVAITEDGSVLAVGNNGESQCEVGDWANIVSVDTYGCFTIGLTDEGSVRLAGFYDGKDVDVREWTDIVDVAAGERFIVGLKDDGTVLADGHNKYGQIEVESWREVIAVDTGWSFTVALTREGEVLFAGKCSNQQKEFEQQKDKWSGVVNISASGGGTDARGEGHTVGLKSDGTVVAIGDNQYGQCEVSEWTDIVKVVAGDWYTVGLKSDGTVVITGENQPGYKYIEYDVLESCADIVDIAAGYGHTVCLHKDGTITAFGFNDDNKCSDTVEWANIMLPLY